MTLELGQKKFSKLFLQGNLLSMKSLEILFKFVQRNKNVKMIDVRENQIETRNREKLEKEFLKKGVELIL